MSKLNFGGKTVLVWCQLPRSRRKLTHGQHALAGLSCYNEEFMIRQTNYDTADQIHLG